jgi:hypothetical protein
MEEIERGNITLVARDNFAIDDAGARAQAYQRPDDQRRRNDYCNSSYSMHELFAGIGFGCWRIQDLSGFLLSLSSSRLWAA